VSATAAGARRAFLVDNIIVFAAQIINKLRTIILLPLLVKGLGTAAFGVWSQTLAFATFAAGILGFNIHLSLVRFMADENTRNGKTYFTLLVSALALSTAGCAAMYVFTPESGVTFLIGAPDDRLFGLALVLVTATSIRLLNLNLYRATNRIFSRSAIDLASSLLELVAIIAAIAAGGTLHTALAISASANVITALGTGVHAATVTAPLGWDGRAFREALRYGAFLVPASLGILLLDRGDRFVLSRVLGPEAVGIYQAHYTLASVVSLVLGPIQTTLVPKVASLWSNDRDAARRYIEGSGRAFAAACFFLVGVLPVLSEPLFRIVANEQIATGSLMSVLLLTSGTTLWGLSVVAQMSLFAAKRTSVIGAVTFLAALLNLGLNVVLAPHVGIIAASASTALTYLITFAAFAFWGGRELRVSWHPAFLLRAAIAAFAAGAIAYVAAPTSLIALVCVGIGAAVIYGGLLLALRAVTPEERRAAWSLIRRRA
jgi:O-antigen/teichoic acid export membrane protein